MKILLGSQIYIYIFKKLPIVEIWSGSLPHCLMVASLETFSVTIVNSLPFRVPMTNGLR